MNHYQTLGVSREATQAQIKQAYRTLAKKFHPDRNPGNKNCEEKFLRISEAYQVLGDKERKAAYDQKRSGTAIKDEKKPHKHRKKSTFSTNERENLFQSASNFEQFFGFQHDGEKIKKNSSQAPDASALFEQFFKTNKKE